MTRNNRIFYLKKGENNVVMTATLKDANNTKLDLTAWTGRIIVVAKGSSTPIIDAAVTISNQLTNTGEVTYSFMATDSDHAVGTYDLEIVMTAPNAAIHKFPKMENGNFGSLVIMPSK